MHAHVHRTQQKQRHVNGFLQQLFPFLNPSESLSECKCKSKSKLIIRTGVKENNAQAYFPLYQTCWITGFCLEAREITASLQSFLSSFSVTDFGKLYIMSLVLET